MEIKRGLLESAVRADPDPERFDGCWLSAWRRRRPSRWERTEPWRRTSPRNGAARTSPHFRQWLEHGAPSDDASGGDDPPGDPARGDVARGAARRRPPTTGR
jgi:hypothetical protein